MFRDIRFHWVYCSCFLIKIYNIVIGLSPLGIHYFSINRAWKDVLTHWGRVTHICVSKLTIIGSDNGLSPGRRQAIIWTNDGTLLIRTSGTNFSEILRKIHPFPFKKMHLKMSSVKWRQFCPGLNSLISEPDNAALLLIGALGTKFIELWIKRQQFSYKKINLKMPSSKCWPFFQPRRVKKANW